MVYYDNVGYLVVDCNTCESKGCFAEEQEYDENNYVLQDEDVEEWINGMLECVDTEVAGALGNLYAGFMCNADGTGVEPAVFLEDSCSVYTSQYAYGTMVSGSDNYELMYMAATTVTSPFTNELSCESIQTISLGDAENLAYEQAQQAYNGEDGGQEEEEADAPEAAEGCQNLFDGAVDMDTCGGYEAEEEEEEEEEAEEEADEDYSWYTYLVAEGGDDAQASCIVVQTLEGEFSGAHTYSESDKDGGGSGHVYDYKSSGAFGGDMSAGKVFGIVIAVIVAMVAAVLVMQSMGGKKDTKKVPLVNNKSGSMA